MSFASYRAKSGKLLFYLDREKMKPSETRRASFDLQMSLAKMLVDLSEAAGQSYYLFIAIRVFSLQ